VTTPRADVVVVCPTPGVEADSQWTLFSGLEQASASDAAWVWCLRAGARPRPDALDALLKAARLAGEPPALLVAGMTADVETGRAIEEDLPAFDYVDQEAVLRLLPHRVAPIRSAPFANCLISRDSFALHGLPDERSFGRYAPAEWTHRVVNEGVGYFAPLSVVPATPVLRASDPAEVIADTTAVIRTGRTGTWTGGELGRALARAVRPGRLRRPPAPTAVDP
jgi:hypothetical protein